MKNEPFPHTSLADQIKWIKLLRMGSIHTITYRKTVKLAKKWDGVTIETESVLQGRFFLDYGDNLSMVKEAHENGMGYGVLKGFHEVEENFLYANDTTGKLAFRVFPFHGSKHSKRYFRNGQETTLEALLAEGLPKSALVSQGQPPVLMLYTDGVKNII